MQSEYGFGGTLSEAFPSQINVDPTELCNLACTHCPHPEFKKSERYGGRSLDASLNTKLVDELATDGAGIVRHLRYSSEGEPLLHSRIFDFLDEAVRRSGTVVSLTTNGTLLDERRAERLLATGLAFVDISIDAMRPETYARIRVRGDLATTRGNVERLIDLKQHSRAGTHIIVSFIEQPSNFAERDEFVQFWQDRGADQVIIRPLHSAAGSVVPTAELIRGQRHFATRRPCLYPWERVLLTPRGTLSFCPVDWVHASTLADFRTHTIREVWAGPLYTALRDAHLRNDFQHHRFCGSCPDWQTTRWPTEGRSYLQMVKELKASA